MEKEIEYEVHYDVVATIKYIGEKTPGEHYFEINRRWAELIFGEEEYEAVISINDKGELELDAECSLNDEEEATIRNMMTEILK